jgi:hypothetical protein
MYVSHIPCIEHPHQLQEITKTQKIGSGQIWYENWAFGGGAVLRFRSEYLIIGECQHSADSLTPK